MNKNNSVWKKTLATLLAALMLAVSIPISICAETVASGNCGNALIWTLDGSGTLTISGTGEMWNWERFDAPWNNHRDSVVTVVIGSSVTSVGDYAFGGCTSLSDITMPSSLTSIGRGAFYYCPCLISITIPDGVTSIGAGAFENCINLMSITIPDSVTSIGTSAFNACYRLVEVINLSSLDLGADGDDSGIAIHAIEVHNGSSKIVNNDGYLFYMSDEAYLVNYIGDDTVVTLPDIGKDYIINDYAFWNLTNLKSITIPNSITSIGKSAFSFCSGLTSITILDGVTSIGDYAFGGCTSLTSIMIPDSVTSIVGNSVFYGCSNLTIYGICDSYVQTYAENNNKPFREIDVESVSISIAFKDSYTEGEALDTAGGKLTVNYVNGYVKVIDITPDMVSGFDPSIVGKRDLTVSYCDKTATFTVEVTEAPIATAYGDANGDGEVNLNDASLVLKYIADWNLTLDLDAADANGDGKVTLSDVSLILKYLSGWDVVLGPTA